jgi:uncharacterized protein YjbI with pentapeptide repeats
VGTVFTKADLRDANFYGADLTRVKFAEALLSGATFEAELNDAVEMKQTETSLHRRLIELLR